MHTKLFRRTLALFGYVAFFAAGPALAQIGPIQPVMVMVGDIPETPHERPDFAEDYSVPIDVYVGADGSITNTVVTRSTGNPEADRVAAAYLRQRQFLPGLDARGEPEASMVKVTVNMYRRGSKKVARVTLKPPPMATESDRLKKMMCADFTFEMNRLTGLARVHDVSLEVLPYTSAHIYMTQKKLPDEVQEKFWDQWPRMLKKIVERCEKNQLQLFYAEVLVPALDGALPETVTASSQ